MFPMRDVESCEGHEPRAIAFERHESGILRDKSFALKVTTMEPVTIGAKHFSGSVYMSAQIIKPADNVAGVIIRTGLFSGPGGSVITTGTAAASGIGDATKPFLAYLSASNVMQLQYPIFLPPGYGLWAKTSSYLDTYITYDLLT